MRTLSLALVAVTLALPAPAVAAPREVTWSEWKGVERGWSRERVERRFGAGRGCEYIRYGTDTVFTGRQYRNTLGNWVSIQYVTRDDGVERVRGKQWNTVGAC